MFTVTVYTTPGCMQCRMTHRALDRAGITYDVIDLATNTAARAYVTEELGYTQAPVVVVNEDPQHHWSGFRPDKITTLAH